ncbi:hypothetical protein ONE63_010354 [Megalurothrips usitatus]|uniref:Peptidase M13 C-terminal domain-containing protein n=1 Tax=Megalurothrips usitatus TaxID=439358 RepID=A0AAV7XMA6_9NEOP|nr:hypothetical protein ONE63_010354 [Megalurothrips usitatus]
MLVEDISKDMSRLVEAADWMHSEARSSAKLKADNLQFIIGYPMDLLNDTFLDAQYKQNNLAVDSFLHNMMVVHKQIEEETFRKYRSEFKGADYTSVNAMVVEVNAYYVPNVLGLPLGILQEPVFNSERPQYMNYGGIGYVIGHESSHGFDENGRLVNHNGTLEMWWDEDTLSSFQEKVRCMVEQYSNITNKDTNVTVNGVLTQSENIADNVGIKLAYRAYQRHVAAHGPEPRIPLRFPDGSSLELSPNQMFWVSFAYFQCAKLSPQELDRTMRTE